MDPEDRSLIVQEAANAGLKIIGWYHSHPTFSPNPTTIDVYNQVIGQNAHQEAEKEVNDVVIFEPYVGAIICPFDVKKKTETSDIVWYFVEHTAGSVPSNGQRPAEVDCFAKLFDPEQALNPLYGLENLASMQRELEHLSKRYAQYTYRTELEAWWTEGVTVSEKMVASLLSRLPSNIGQQKIDKFAEKVLFSTRAVWNVYGASMPPVKNSSMEIDAATKSLGGKTATLAVEKVEIVPKGGDRADELISDVDEETEEE
jgi:hypothetical protein